MGSAHLAAFIKAVAQRRAARLARPRARKHIPRQQQPNAIRLGYSQSLQPLLERMRALVESHVVSRLPELVAVAGQVHDSTITKANYSQKLSAAVAKASRDLFAQFTNEKLRKLALQYGDRTAAFQKSQLAGQFVAALGFDPLKSEPWLKPVLNAFAHQNADLIKSVPERYFAEIEARTLEALRTGERAEDIAKDYQARFGVSESRARLIARDQVGKLNGQLNITRQRRAGIKQWVWRTSEDERVRPEHEELDGQTFGIDAAPSEGYPGEPINCRCTAEPDVQSEIDALDDDPVVEPEEREELAVPRAPEPTIASVARELIHPEQAPPPTLKAVPAWKAPPLPTPPATTTSAPTTTTTTAPLPPAPPSPSKTFPAYSSVSGKGPQFAVANQRLHAASDKLWRNVLKRADQQQLIDYTANSARLNAYVSNSYDPNRDPAGDQSVALAARAKALDKVMRKTTVGEDLTTFRAMDARSLGLDTQKLAAFVANPQSALPYLNKKIGKTFKDPAYGSTSLDYGVAAKFMRPERVMLEVRIPAGTRGFYFNGDSKMTKFVGEAELLLRRKQKYTLHSVTVKTGLHGDPILHLVVEAL